MKTESVAKLSYYGIGLFWAIMIVMIFFGPYREMKTFNKYKSDSQPEATYVDALFSQLRITSD